MMNTYNIKEQSGRSMVEMLGVLAIVGVLSIGGIAGYSKAMAKYKINKTLDQVSMLITNIRTTFGNQPSYRGLSVATAINYELVGTDLTLGQSTKLTDAYSGDVQINAATAAGAECSGTGLTDYCPMFTVSFAGLDRTACATIASSDWGGTASSGLVAIKISQGATSAADAEKTLAFATPGGGVHVWGEDDYKKRLPVDYTQAYDDCSGESNNNTITWLYN